jgi:hypothetical protein
MRAQIRNSALHEVSNNDAALVAVRETGRDAASVRTLISRMYLAYRGKGLPSSPGATHHGKRGSSWTTKRTLWPYTLTRRPSMSTAIHRPSACRAMSVLDDFGRMRLYGERASEFGLLVENEPLSEVRLRYRIIDRHYRELADPASTTLAEHCDNTITRSCHD